MRDRALSCLPVPVPVPGASAGYSSDQTGVFFSRKAVMPVGVGVWLAASLEMGVEQVVRRGKWVKRGKWVRRGKW